ncbi:hypothetical protein TVAG_473460 [Trichomonas vaginalis G3]|uniref:Prefoldin subunit family protein n=1 Tax=Trichomonas vaginalis (strain ATCC PRA-98 / G3) TaxID=412133 RepID=A2EUG3_TRIV3|nr:prefoldin family [Trichomonas vaginalis G3]EAY03722.1 hypothetical protein TVAG_473460 [Trichomonas vaginalis G3]KAI5529014.1 prefoldin family [Trichomonas vaginalis G3]|eukprot:XP_001315945.1 hypothetical protein [Trichomonas vaginalis G3]
MSRGGQIMLPEEQMKQFYKLRAEEARLEENLGKFTAQLGRELQTRRTKYITRHEVAKLNPSTPVYLSVGKAFVLDNVPNTLATLRADLAKQDKSILTIKKAGIHIADQQTQIKLQIEELVKPYLPK